VGREMIVDFGTDVWGALCEEGGVVWDRADFLTLSGFVFVDGGVKWEEVGVGSN
jgi:hypothetical protein